MIRRIKFSILTLFFAAFFVHGMHAQDFKLFQGTQAEKEKILEATRSYVASHMSSEIEMLRDEPVIVDKGQYWVVFYEWPVTSEGITIGGRPEFYVDKKTYQVVNVVRGM